MRHGEKVKARILSEGVAILRDNPEQLTLRKLGVRLRMTHQGILYYFPSAQVLKDAIAQEAVRCEDDAAIRYLIVTKNPAVETLPGSVRDRVMLG